MKAVRKLATNRLELVEVATPRPGPGDLLVRVEACGVCGSDRHMLAGEYPTAVPVTLGHEFCGTVEEVGAGVTRFSPGMRITGDPNIACGHCPACRLGRVNLCENLVAIGVQRDGGFAQYVLVPEGQAYGLAASMPAIHGAFIEPLACCLHGLDVARIVPGQSVAVLGGGVIGMLMVQLARLAGAAVIVLVTRQAERRTLALEIGATHTIDPSAHDAVAALRALSPGGVDVVLECAGVPETFSGGVAMARSGGVVVVFGVTPQGVQVPVMPFDILVREIRIEGAYLNPHTHGRASAMIEAGTLEIDRLVSRTIGLDALPDALAAPPPRGEIKTVVLPWG
ncbi:iditol 2-dehydrogenase [Arsenicitalea aurantiaca]|uniref:Iditol 2-dehydrogenase n=1 Tax=Arsenicitalea aurantiaca TaxID=1783274 RepID=A0A433X5F9_9HYPH|nr:zinc-dependent alcohol dehydrogenase family protein [Arsenicitalea aurantiaca]RUT29281.1 iditol 2-dehydrogenase [Arsenicitalea aurantiaca]